MGFPFSNGGAFSWREGVEARLERGDSTRRCIIAKVDTEIWSVVIISSIVLAGFIWGHSVLRRFFNLSINVFFNAFFSFRICWISVFSLLVFSVASRIFWWCFFSLLNDSA